MKTTITKNDVTENPLVEQQLCSYASSTGDYGELIVLTDIITKKVAFKVVGNSSSKIIHDLDEAINLYNLIQL